jgi:hypothetical protein
MATDLAAIRSILAATPARWRDLTGRLPVEMLQRKPMPGEWSAAECLNHILETEKYVFPVRVAAFLAGRDFPGFNPDEQAPVTPPSPAEMAEELAALREKALARLASLVEADLPRQANHAELGSVTLEQMLNEWAVHDLNHTIQAERALMQPFLDLCGPWRQYFSDHDAALARK